MRTNAGVNNCVTVYLVSKKNIEIVFCEDMMCLIYLAAVNSRRRDKERKGFVIVYKASS